MAWLSLGLPSRRRFAWVLAIVFCAIFYSDAGRTHEALPPHQANIADRLAQQLVLTDAEKTWLRDHPVIRVGIDGDFAPYSNAKARGFEGVVPDYLSVLTEVLGHHFLPQSGLSWSSILEAAEARELDMIATAAKNEDREAYLSFTEFFIPTPLVIMARDDNADVFRASKDLAGKRVALVRNYAASKRVMAEHPDAIEVVVETPLEGLQALAAGEVAAYVGVLGVNTYLARTHGLDNVVVAGRYDLEPTGQRFAVRNDWPELINILDKALALLTVADQSAIMEPWIPVVAPVGRVNPDGTLALSDAERQYIEDRRYVTMCVDPNWMPYERIDESGQHIGIAADYIKAFSDMLGLPVQLVKTETWAQSEAFAEQRKCDILSLLNHSEKRARYLNFTDPYVEAPVVLVSNQDVTYLDGLKSVNGKTLGIVEGYVYEDIIKQDYPGIEIVYVATMDEALTKISEGEIFSTIASLYIVTTQIQQLGLSNLKIAGHTEFTNRFRVGVRNDDPMMLQLFQKAVSSMDPQTENEILQSWISVRLEHGVDYELLWQVLAVVGVALSLLLYRQREVGRYNRKLNAAYGELSTQNEALERLSATDPLTGANNRLKIDEMLAYEIDQSNRYDHACSVILLDIDHFKRINDTYGHQAGDAVLKALCDVLSAHVRKTDTFGRWGGEEFIVICPQVATEGAVQLAENLRALVETVSVEEGLRITASFGVATYRTGDKANDLIKRADEALYAAKTAGRNRVELAA
ncbi:MAG: transporter substrate-binding domain-containing diguanylate cyclase [Magnetovibrionaceae bacterium]